MRDALLVGLGQIGMGYDIDASHLNKVPRQVKSHAKALFESGDFNLVAAVDIDASKRYTFSSIYNKPTHDSVAQALENTEPELVVIATPVENHLLNFQEAIACPSVSTVLCEKPLATDVVSAQLMHDLATRSGIRIFLNYIRRSTPGAQMVKEALKDTSKFSLDGGTAFYTGTLLNGGTHIVDLLQFWFDGNVRYAGRKPSRSAAKTSDELIAELECEGVIIQLVKNLDPNVELNGIRLVGTSYTIEYALTNSQAVTITPRKEGLQDRLTQPPFGLRNGSMDIGFRDYQARVISHLADAMNGQPVSLATSVDAIKNLDLIRSINRKEL
jgi:predicted dehydrogenase